MYNPVSGTAPQYQDSNSQNADGYYLKYYIANTTTPLSMATDSTGATLLVKCKLNPDGMPISNPADNDTVFIPHLNQAYREVIYRNETDADNNTTANALSNIPSISPLVGGVIGTAPSEIPLNSDLGSMAYVEKQASATDATVGRGLLAGAKAEALDSGIVSTLNATSYSGVAQGFTTGGNVIESDTNANGKYVMFADGSAMAFGVTSNIPATTNTVGSGYQSPTLLAASLPLVFSAPPSITLAGVYVSGNRSWPSLGAISASNFSCIAHSFSNNSIIKAQYVAVGRWK